MRLGEKSGEQLRTVQSVLYQMYAPHTLVDCSRCIQQGPSPLLLLLTLDLAWCAAAGPPPCPRPGLLDQRLAVPGVLAERDDDVPDQHDVGREHGRDRCGGRVACRGPSRCGSAGGAATRGREGPERTLPHVLEGGKVGPDGDDGHEEREEDEFP